MLLRSFDSSWNHECISYSLRLILLVFVPMCSDFIVGIYKQVISTTKKKKKEIIPSILRVLNHYRLHIKEEEARKPRISSSDSTIFSTKLTCPVCHICKHISFLFSFLGRFWKEFEGGFCKTEDRDYVLIYMKYNCKLYCDNFLLFPGVSNIKHQTIFNALY